MKAARGLVFWALLAAVSTGCRTEQKNAQSESSAAPSAGPTAGAANGTVAFTLRETIARCGGDCAWWRRLASGALERNVAGGARGA